jgi:hypothetical protein
MGSATISDLRAAEAAGEERFDDEPQDVHGGDELAEDEQGQFQLVLGGKAPTTNAVRLYGGAVEVEPPEGGFEKGASYVLRVEVACHKVSFTDERDQKTGQVVGCRDERGLRITGVSVIG